MNSTDSKHKGELPMKTLIELVSEIVSSHASNTTMTTDQIVIEIQTIHAALKNLENPLLNTDNSEVMTEQPKESSITVRQAFRKDEVICMVCQKGGFKTLKKHLSTAHQLTPGQYRKQFGIKSTQKLAAKNFSDARRKAAEERGMTDILAKAREKRMSNLKSGRTAAAKPAKPASSSGPVKGAGRPKKVSK